MPDLITTDLVELDATYGDSKDDVIRALAGRVAAVGRSTNADGLADDVFAREAKSATGMPGGLAIPHCRSEHVTESTLAFTRLSPPVDFGAKDAPADLVFMIAAPASGDQEHMKLLTQLARALVRKDFTDALRAASSPDEVVDLVSEVVKPPEQPATTATATTTTAAAVSSEATAGGTAATAVATAPAVDGGTASIVAVTSCPTGIAHTFMAAEALEEAGRKAGIDIHVEPQGSVGATRLSPKVIANADAVIFAADVGVRDIDRFAGLAEVKASVKQGIHEADELVARAVAAAADPNAPRVAGFAGAGGGEGPGAETQSGWIKARTALLTGVSYMIPFIAAGGLLIALAFLFGGYNVDPALATSNTLWNLPDSSLAGEALFDSALFLYLGAVFLFIGQAAFTLFVPALGGYIAYALADRPGIAPGFVAGLVAVNVGAGFLGAIVGGFIAGLVAAWIAGLDVPRFVRGLMPVVIIPLFATLITGGLMVLVLGRPLAYLTEQLQDGLSDMSGSYTILLGVVLGLMMCFDLGGPVNKAAYVFATTGLLAGGSANLKIMAAVMLSGMVPPLACALASTVRPALFTEPERENGRAAWLLGASFISEGAIPFAAAAPLRVIPAMMLGGAVTGALSMTFGVELSAPHGGIFVLFAVDGVLGFFIALIAGTLVAAAAVIALKRIHVPGDEEAEQAVEPVAA
jgi:PTS system fructose-specific IIC component